MGWLVSGHPLKFCWKSFLAYLYEHNEHMEKMNAQLQAVLEIWLVKIWPRPPLFALSSRVVELVAFWDIHILTLQKRYYTEKY